MDTMQLDAFIDDLAFNLYDRLTRSDGNKRNSRQSISDFAGMFSKVLNDMNINMSPEKIRLRLQERI